MQLINSHPDSFSLHLIVLVYLLHIWLAIGVDIYGLDCIVACVYLCNSAVFRNIIVSPIATHLQSGECSK